jgi:hypothetical protein
VAAIELCNVGRAADRQSAVFDGSGTLAVRRHQGGRDDAVLRGDFVDDRPNLGDLAGAVD